MENEKSKEISNNDIILNDNTINKLKNAGDVINIGAGILSSVNPAFSLIQMIKEYRNNGDREYYNKNTEKAQKEKIENEEIDKNNKTPNLGLKKIKWVNRNVVIDSSNTIFWKDFEKYYELQAGEMGFVLLGQTTDEEGNKSKEWAYIGKSFIKLQNLGILELDYINTTGNINSLNVERFHITLFGNELLKYIK